MWKDDLTRQAGNARWVWRVLLCLALSTSAQVGEFYKGFKLPDYYKSGHLKSQITGAEARPQPNGLWLVEKMRIENYLEDGRTNLVATAPQCFVDIKNHVAFSPRRLLVVTADGQLNIQGEGFFYQQTNFDLTISNQVATTIQRELIRSTNSPAKPLVSFPQPNAPPTNDLIRIFSDHFVLESPSNLAIYSGRAHVDDAQMALGCQTLTIQRSTEGTIESIVADQNVAMTNKLDQSRAMGDHGIYSLEPGRERVVLTGEQARWQGGESEGQASKFTFDRGANTLLAEQKPSIRLPRAALSAPDWLPGAATATANAPEFTNQFVNVSAEEILIHLPTTNQLARRMSAQNNVLIVSPADKSQGSGDHALYDEGAGTLELSGHALWQSDQRIVKGETLIFDRTNKLLVARQNAWLRMPLSSFGGQTAPSSNPNKPAPPPETLEVFSDGFVYRPAAIIFQDHVRANYFQGAAQGGWLTSGFLNIGFKSNRIETLVATTQVTLEQPATGTNGARRTDRKLKCENLTIQFSTNGLMQSILAETNVVAQQTETRAGRALPAETELTAARATVFFFAHTNEVREIRAEGSVTIKQDTKSARGAKAVYTASNNVVELSGHPTADTPMGRITEAEVLFWNRAHNTLKATGKKVVGMGEVPGKGPNRSGFVFPK